MNKRKLINDPVHGFLKIESDLLYDLTEHPYFQRLRRIKQLGLTDYVYPGATHSRFLHAIGATHLMGTAIEVIRSKGHEITDKEAEAVRIAILLHDIGHGPFSHTLEYSFVEGTTHEDISILFMQELNSIFDGRLDLAMQIFLDRHPKKFLHQLVSSQLDMDRLDYLRRDSFYTGVTEGVVGSDRIIKMLEVVDNSLVVEAKGIYSVEKFLIARRLMYWQVYLHKTVIASEELLIKILKRAKILALGGHKLLSTPTVAFFLGNRIDKQQLLDGGGKLLDEFAKLDDMEVMASIKMWAYGTDWVLARLCNALLTRKLNKIQMYNHLGENELEFLHDVKVRTCKAYNISEKEASYFAYSKVLENLTYSYVGDQINIVYRDGSLKNIGEASDMFNHDVLSKDVKKFFLCYPKEFAAK